MFSLSGPYSVKQGSRRNDIEYRNVVAAIEKAKTAVKARIIYCSH